MDTTLNGFEQLEGSHGDLVIAVDRFCYTLPCLVLDGATIRNGNGIRIFYANCIIISFIEIILALLFCHLRLLPLCIK